MSPQEQITQRKAITDRALITGWALSVLVLPFIYHLLPFMFVPIIVPTVALFALVFYTGLTHGQRIIMLKLNIFISAIIVFFYEWYVVSAISFLNAGFIKELIGFGVTDDWHIDVTVWLVQVVVVTFLFVIYQSVRSLMDARAGRIG